MGTDEITHTHMCACVLVCECVHTCTHTKGLDLWKSSQTDIMQTWRQTSRQNSGKAAERREGAD